jgi:hypothetical protein
MVLSAFASIRESGSNEQQFHGCPACSAIQRHDLRLLQNLLALYRSICLREPSPSERHDTSPDTRTSIADLDCVRTTHFNLDLVAEVDEYDVRSRCSTKALRNSCAGRRLKTDPFNKAQRNVKQRHLPHTSKSDGCLDAHHMHRNIGGRCDWSTDAARCKAVSDRQFIRHNHRLAR